MQGNKDGAKGAKAYPDKKPKPVWMLKNSAEGEMHKKTVNGKHYHWCPKHESRTCHLPQDCRKLLNNKPSNDKSIGKEAGNKFYPSPKKSKNPKMQLSKALQTVMEEDLEDEVASDSKD